MISYRRTGGVVLMLTVAAVALALAALSIAVMVTLTIAVAATMLAGALASGATALLIRALPASFTRRFRTSGQNAPRAGHQQPVIEAQVVTADVPPDYLPLHIYLDRRYATSVVLTFAQMEALLGRALPEAAMSEPGWWTREASDAHRHSEAWTTARRTAYELAEPVCHVRTVAVIAVWIGILLTGAAVIILVTSWRQRTHPADLGRVSEQWLAEQRANDHGFRSGDR